MKVYPGFLYICLQANSNVSTSVLSRVEKQFVQKLTIKHKVLSQHGNSKAECWRYFGYLVDKNGLVLDEDRVFCEMCLKAQQTLGDKGHISKVTSFSSATSTGNMKLHLSMRHDINTNCDEKSQAITGYLKKYSSKNEADRVFQQRSAHEVTRDMVIWFCRDLLAFENSAKVGFADFFKVNAPTIHIPSPQTLAGTALEDIYQSVKLAVQEMLSGTRSLSYV